MKKTLPHKVPIVKIQPFAQQTTCYMLFPVAINLSVWFIMITLYDSIMIGSDDGVRSISEYSDRIA